MAYCNGRRYNLEAPIESYPADPLTELIMNEGELLVSYIPIPVELYSYQGRGYIQYMEGRHGGGTGTQEIPLRYAFYIRENKLPYEEIKHMFSGY